MDEGEFITAVMRLIAAVVMLVLLVSVPVSGGVPGTSGPMALAAVKTFMYQLQNLEDSDSLGALARSSYDLVVVEPTGTTVGNAGFDMKGMVAKLHGGRAGRIVLAYLDAGEAETFRTYWGKDWVAPTRTAKGQPDFILIPDPDGWSGDYPVAYWDRRWQAVMVLQVKLLMRAGFDGVYLDWIDAWDDDTIRTQANLQKVDSARSMVDFLSLIRSTARGINPNALLVQQNAFGLIDADPRLTDAIDALGVEDTWYSGEADAKWDSKKSGDIPNREHDESSTGARLKQYEKFLAAGKPVFTVDYCLNPKNAARVYAEARAHHLIPLVTRVSLDHITTTPPPVP